MPLRIKRRRGSNPRRPVRGGPGNAPSFPFTITSIVPDTIALGAGPTPVDVIGEDFQPGSQVFVNGVAQTSSTTPPSLVEFTYAVVDASVPGAKAVQVRRLGLTSNTRVLNVPFPVPTLTSATFDGTNLAVVGSGFFAVGTGALIDGTIPVTFTYLTGTTATVPVPQEVIDTPGNHDLRIVNPAPGGGTSNVVSFPVKFTPPVILSQSSDREYTGRASGTVTILGNPDPNVSSFYPVSTVRADGVTVPSTYVDPTHIQYSLSPAIMATPGPKEITVFNPTVGGGGGPSNPLYFTAFTPTLIALSITEVVQYFDGFDVAGAVDEIDSNFEITYNNVGQPTTIVDAQNVVAHVTTAANSVPGTTMVRLRDTISGASSNAVGITVYPWTPADILDPAVRWWLDGTSLVDDGTGRASAWNDRTAGARHISQANAAKRPLIVANAHNGQTAARCDNVRGDRFETGVTWLTSGTAGIITKTAFTVWIVAKTTLLGTGQKALSDPPGYLGVANTITTPERLGALIDGGGTVVPYVAFNWSSQSVFVFRHRQVGAAAYARVNRSAEVTLSVPNINLFNPTTVLLPQGNWKGDVFFVFVANAELNPTYKALLDNFLSYNYALPFGTPGQAPSITSVTPNTATQLDLPFLFIVEDLGGSFTPTSVVNVGRYPQATEYLSPTQLRARMPTDGLATAGGRAITVADAGGISGPTGITVFAYVNQPGPNLYSTTPNTAYQHGAPLPIDCNGVGFTATSVVHANGVACPTVFDTATHITATLPVTALDVLPGPLITVHDGAFVSNPLEITLTPWSPGSIVSLTAWYRADTVVLGTGTEVAEWTDLSGNGRHLTQTTATKRPLLVTSHPNFNGKPVVDFDGVDDYMTGAALSAMLGTGYTNVGCVFRADAITGTGAITAPYNNNCVVGASAGFFGFALRNTPVAYYYENDGAYQVATNSNIAVGVTCQALLTAANSSAMNATLNNVAGTPDTIGSVNHGAPVFTVGSNFTFVANFLNGQIAEVFAASLPLTAQDTICWPNYCRYKYGTP